MKFQDASIPQLSRNASRLFSRCSLWIVLCLSIFVLASAPLAHCQEDSENSATTPWWTYFGQNSTDIINTINSKNARITNITFDTTSSTFTVTYVPNTGSYAKQWWWYVGIDAPTLAQNLTNNHARLVSLQAYDIGGGNIRFAVAMIANAGADAKTWWYTFGQSGTGITNLVNANHARLTTLESYVSNGQTYYAAIMISNTGTGAKAWWWFPGASGQTIANAANSNQARILYLSSASNGNFNAVLESCSSGCPGWAWYYGYNGGDIVSKAHSSNARILTVDNYPGCGGQCYVATMISDNGYAAPAGPASIAETQNWTFGNGVPVGGNSDFTVWANGSILFEGHLHDSGFPSYNDTVVCVIKDNQTKTAYVLPPHSGHMDGTIESGSRDDNWVIQSSSTELANNWDEFASGSTWNCQASSSADWNVLANDALAVVGVVLSVVQLAAPAAAADNHIPGMNRDVTASLLYPNIRMMERPVSRSMSMVRQN